jgi:hypothetical protein
MNTKTLSSPALSLVDQYSHFTVGNATCSVPYFNNKTIRARAALRSTIGKGSPQEIMEEFKMIMVKDHVDQSTITSELLKKTLTDHNIGIDCSAFAYYLLNSECVHRFNKPLYRSLHFPHAKGLIGKIRSMLRPIENCDVATLAHTKNSTGVQLQDIQPGDMITMIGGPYNADRDHVLVITQVVYEGEQPKQLSYVHAIAYPEDGVYGTGIKQGSITIINPDKTIAEQEWKEQGAQTAANRLVERAKKSQTDIRRLRVLHSSK